MFSTQNNAVIIGVLTCVLLPCLCSVVAQEDKVIFDENLATATNLGDRDPRQLTFITTPFRRAASTTRDIVRFIRDYSTGRFANGTHTEPQTYIGKRAAALIQQVTRDNIRDAVNYILESPAAPVVTGWVKHIDRDTLQLLSPNAGASILARRNATSTTPPSSSNSTRTIGNSTTTPSAPGGKGEGGNSTTLISLVVDENTTVKSKSSLGGGDVAQSNFNPESSVKTKVVPAVENEDDEDDSTEDD